MIASAPAAALPRSQAFCILAPMRAVTRIAWVSFALLMASCHTAPGRAHHPNVVVFLVDDLGWH